MDSQFSDFTNPSKRQELEVEKQVLQRRIREIDSELKRLNPPLPDRTANPASNRKHEEQTRFDEFMENAFAIVLSGAAIAGFGLMLL